jgi:hypothetical protein
VDRAAPGLPWISECSGVGYPAHISVRFRSPKSGTIGPATCFATTLLSIWEACTENPYRSVPQRRELRQATRVRGDEKMRRHTDPCTPVPAGWRCSSLNCTPFQETRRRAERCSGAIRQALMDAGSVPPPNAWGLTAAGRGSHLRPGAWGNSWTKKVLGDEPAGNRRRDRDRVLVVIRCVSEAKLQSDRVLPRERLGWVMRYWN